MIIFSKIFNLKIIIPIVVVVAAAVGAKAMMDTAPKPRKKKPVVIMPTVEVAVFEPGSHEVRLEVMGTVMAAHEISLESQVSGEIVSTSENFIPGGYFKQGQEILRINPEDYKLALSEIEAQVADAEYNLRVEQGHQNVAGREWDLLKKSSKGTDQEAELALRKPHLKKAKADLAAAKAKLKQARLDLARTKITAPFSSMVQSRSADQGSTINIQETLATLVGTEEFWVQASVPVDRLDHVVLPHGGRPGARAVVISGANGHTNKRTGQVVRLLPSLESEGRMARVLISIKDPMNLEEKPGIKPLLLGSYVKVLIQGRPVENSFDIPRKAFRDNDKIWVLKEDGTLDIREVSTVWRDSDSVLLTEGLAPGEQVVVSAIAAPMQGMKLQTAESGPGNARREDANPGTENGPRKKAGPGKGGMNNG